MKDNNRRVSPDFLINTDGILSAQDRPQEEIVSFNAWFKALFDSNSEGIEDTILRLDLLRPDLPLCRC